MYIYSPCVAAFCLRLPQHRLGQHLVVRLDPAVLRMCTHPVLTLCVAVCCSVLQCRQTTPSSVANVYATGSNLVCCCTLQCVAECFNALRCFVIKNRKSILLEIETETETETDQETEAETETATHTCSNVIIKNHTSIFYEIETETEIATETETAKHTCSNHSLTNRKTIFW